LLYTDVVRPGFTNCDEKQGEELLVTTEGYVGARYRPALFVVYTTDVCNM